MALDCLAEPPDATACADLRDCADAYVYLLGVYLGDGCLTQARRRVWRLRIFQDRRYPGIVGRCSWAIELVTGRRAGRNAKQGCYEIYSYWKHWRCLFPQHAPGPKHHRAIVLAPWQEVLVSAFPHEFVRGLIHSDGCRVINRVRRTWAETSKTYEYSRYHFSNRSADIRSMFVDVCAKLGVEARPNNQCNLSVARRRSVAILDSIVGPKA